MKRLWRAIEVLAWTAFFAFAVLVLALRYWFLPNIERYRGEIVAAVSRTVGQEVRIGGIQTGWLGMRPHISLTDVRIIDADGREVLALPSVDNVVSWRAWIDYPLDVRRGQGALRLWATLREGKPKEGTADVALSDFAAQLARELP